MKSRSEMVYDWLKGNKGRGQGRGECSTSWQAWDNPKQSAPSFAQLEKPASFSLGRRQTLGAKNEPQDSIH